MHIIVMTLFISLVNVTVAWRLINLYTVLTLQPHIVCWFIYTSNTLKYIWFMATVCLPRVVSSALHSIAVTENRHVWGVNVLCIFFCFICCCNTGVTCMCCWYPQVHIINMLQVKLPDKLSDCVCLCLSKSARFMLTDLRRLPCIATIVL